MVESKGKMKKTSKRVKIEEEECENGNVVSSQKRKEMVSDIFRSSRIRHNSIKLPKCHISRGLLMAIIFLILFGLLMIWFVFSSDNLDDDIDSKVKKPIVKNKTQDLQDYDYDNIGDKTNLSNKLFVLFSTVFIVLAIISFVFIGALVHYFHKPKGAYRTGSRSHSIVSSIFSHHNHHNHLYYLDRDITKEEEMRKEKKKKKKANKLEEEKRKESNETNETQVKIDEIEKKVLTPPTIIVNESES